MPLSNAEKQRRFREARVRLIARLQRQNRVLERQVAAAERERDRLRKIAAERLGLLESAIRRDRDELGRLVEGEATAAMVESGVPVIVDAEAP